MVEDSNIFSTDISWTSRKKTNSFVLVSAGREEGSRLRVARIPILFTMSVGGRNTSHEYTLLRYIELTRPINMVDEMPVGFFLRCNVANELHHSRRRGTSALKKRSLIVGNGL